MRIPLFKRLTITLLNIIFPPIAVALLTGWTSRDTLLNACLFLLAIIPSHIHGFYISFVYFHRKRRVRRGVYPGKLRKVGVYSEKVLTGGAGWEGAEELDLKRRGKLELGREDGGVGGEEVGRRRSKKRDSKRVSRLSTKGVQPQPVSPVVVQQQAGYGDSPVSAHSPGMQQVQGFSTHESQLDRARSRHY